MITRTKIFLLWLLALAIPVQGFAAVAQLGCAPSHPMSMAIPMKMMHTMHTMQMSHDDMPSMAGMHMAEPDGSHLAQADQHQHTGPAQHHPVSTSSCSACTVCAVGAILPLSLTPLPALQFPAGAHIALAQHGFVGYMPENPDRPPSLSL